MVYKINVKLFVHALVRSQISDSRTIRRKKKPTVGKTEIERDILHEAGAIMYSLPWNGAPDNRDELAKILLVVSGSVTSTSTSAFAKTFDFSTF